MRKLFFLAILLACTTLLSACWDRYEIEERAIILGLAVDYADEESESFTIPEVTYTEGENPMGDDKPQYKVTAQLAVPGKIKLGPEGGGGAGADETSWVIQTVGFSLSDAMMNLQQQLAEKLYLGHLQVVVVNEKLAKDGIENINDYLKREYEVRRTSWMIISEDKAEEVLKAAPPMETVPALYISDTLENAMKFGKLPREYLGKVWVDVSDIGIEPVLPYVKVIEGDRILVKGLAYFKGKKMIGEMTPFEIGAYLAMKERNLGGYTVATKTDDGGVYLVESTFRKSDIKIELKNGQPAAKINVEIEADIAEETNTTNLSGKKLKEIEKETSNSAEEKFEELVQKWQKDESDVLGLGARIRALHPRYWKNEVGSTDEWVEIYKEMDIQVNVKYEIERTGMDWK